MRLNIKKDFLDEFYSVIKINAEGARKQSGCLRFDLLKEEGSDTRFVLYESYTSGEVLDYHMRQDHFKPIADFLSNGGGKIIEVIKANGVDYQDK